ncbi:MULTISPECIES: CotO family spore coat protein [Sediminibacillus]|uniref:CotO family spore coat protein n=1 Tax=Sediminibacillus TaxID=482460 RepID=UPI00047A6616|nr:CotO family spore coat protein [Sediminibacillus terrae]
MKGNKNTAREPMLYITQPKMEKPTASMQTDYRTPRKKKRKPDRGSSIKEKEIRKRSNGKESEEEEKENALQQSEHSPAETEGTAKEKTEENTEPAEVSGNEQEAKETAITQRTSRKRFRDMTNEEKIDYFVGLPRTVPRMKCEVVTDKDTHRGIIYDYQEGTVYMKTIKRPFKAKIDQETIKSIKLLGF